MRWGYLRVNPWVFLREGLGVRHNQNLFSLFRWFPISRPFKLVFCQVDLLFHRGWTKIQKERSQATSRVQISDENSFIVSGRSPHHPAPQTSTVLFNDGRPSKAKDFWRRGWRQVDARDCRFTQTPMDARRYTAGPREDLQLSYLCQGLSQYILASISFRWDPEGLHTSCRGGDQVVQPSSGPKKCKFFLYSIIYDSTDWVLL